jgi:hypothetical protein
VVHPVNAKVSDSHLKEAAVLTRAVENVMRRFVRLLIGRMSLVRFQELVRIVFVQEAEAFLRREKPGKNIPMTKLALLTGLDTRTLGKVKGENEDGVPVHEKPQFLKDITPECSVLDFWQVNPDYIDNDSIPLELPLQGKKPSFESLMSQTITSRGITVSSLLERLRVSGSIEIDADRNVVRMLDGRYWPFQQDDDKKLIEIGLLSTSNLVDTVNHNLSAMGGGVDPFFHRSTWSTRMQLENAGQLRNSMRKLLTASEQEVTKLLAELEDVEERENQITAGVGIFYFEEEHSGTSEKK